MKISIITPCLNRANYLEEAIRSVVNQNSPDVEHIIVDGGSTDGTLNIPARYPRLKLITGPDQGMYDAINKGLAIAQGDILGFLNSDDLYAENVFSDIERKFQDNDVLAVAGQAIIFESNPDGSPHVMGEFFPRSASLLELSTTGSPFFNAWFFRKSVFETIGNFRIEYRIAADSEFMLRLALSGLAYTTLDRLVYQYRHHAGSMTFDMNDQKLEKIVKENVVITDFYLRQQNLASRGKDLLRRARLQDTLDGAMRAIYRRDLRRFFFYAVTGTKYSLLWGGKILGRVIDKFLRNRHLRS